MSIRWITASLVVFVGCSFLNGCDFGAYNNRATERSIEIREAEDAEEEKKLEENGPAEEG